MNRLCLLAASALLVSCGASTSVETKKDYAKADVTKYMKTITQADLKKHLYIVAGDDMQGRNTGEEGQKKAGRYLIDQYKKDGISFPKGASDFYQPVPSAFMTRAFSPKLGDSENIWAYIEGTEKPDEVLVISAHYDHVGMKNGEVYNGADDDGSGTVALLEIAQAFMQAKKDGYGPKRSILFLHVTGEEHGLHGSRYYSENPLFPIKNTIADLNIDMIGRRDEEHKNNGNYVYVIGSDRLSTDLHNINEEANKKYTNLKLDYTFNAKDDPNHFYERSDHYNFAKKGIPIIFYFNGVHEDYHKQGDEPQKIEYDLLAKRTQLAFVTAWELANRENRPVVDKK
ncbi:M28 family metallopeptidase [Flavobacterium sp. DG1-102-2]|uniref:M28 family metallopeptidase n=1 Tax=Flavobacterium sp. DG1-102-2 TaxID=3081663 RepID=UPI00294A0A73|nr:M28 family metallopeptidase [Flavobacterium sp. DG1-102-2]MDV6168170.1 M28 family metallopeptidase [Flavobacterium sp. DG1-102-2]